MEEKTAVIIVDTGFSLESMQTAENILAVYDLSSGFTATGNPYLSQGEDLSRFSGDPLNHGSLVLKSLTSINPKLPLVLIRAYSDDVRLIRTEFNAEGVKNRLGWTDAYLLAVDFLKEKGYSSVANFSFGGYTHAMDGTGWEAHSLRQAVGPGKAGHVILAGAGSGSSRSIHASWCTAGGEHTKVRVSQKTATTYNLWEGLKADSVNRTGDWKLEVFRDGVLAGYYEGSKIPLNFWNNRRQLTFHVAGAGEVVFRLSSFDSAGTERDFDCWINHQDDACFLDHEDPMLIAEPAIFPEVVAVGLEAGSYASDQETLSSKPEVLLSGNGPVSFRLPEVVAEVAAWLLEDPSLDSEGVKDRLLQSGF